MDDDVIPVVEYLNERRRYQEEDKHDEIKQIVENNFKNFLARDHDNGWNIREVTDAFMSRSMSDMRLALQNMFCIDNNCKSGSFIRPWGAMMISVLSPVNEREQFALEPLAHWWREYAKKDEATAYQKVNVLGLYVRKMERIEELNLITERRYRKELIDAYEKLMFDTTNDRERTFDKKKYCELGKLRKQYFNRYINELNNFSYRAAQMAEGEHVNLGTVDVSTLKELRRAKKYMNELSNLELDCLVAQDKNVTERERMVAIIEMGFLDTEIKVTLAEYYITPMETDGIASEWRRRLEELRQRVRIPYSVFRRIVKEETKVASKKGSILHAIRSSPNSIYLDEASRRLAKLSDVILQLEGDSQ